VIDTCTYGQTHDDGIYRASIASRGKNHSIASNVTALWKVSPSML